MDKIAIHEFTDDIRTRCLSAAGFAAGAVADLGGFESFVFAGSSQIVRCTHNTHRNAEQIQAELEFVRYLADGGASVARPVALAENRYLADIDNFHICVFEKAPGQAMLAADWGPDLWRAWGEQLGRFHSLSMKFNPVHKRISWQEDSNHEFRSRLPGHLEHIIDKGEGLLSALANLPTETQDYGLIHGDAHPGNFFIDDGQLTFFDFDDAIYIWYAYDIATILFTVTLVQHIETTREAQEAEVRRFLPIFFEGYSKHAKVTDFMLKHMDLFLKLRELSLFAVVHAFFDVENLTEWYPKKFMLERQVRIENDEPYLNLDFSKL